MATPKNPVTRFFPVRSVAGSWGIRSTAFRSVLDNSGPSSVSGSVRATTFRSGPMPKPVFGKPVRALCGGLGVNQQNSKIRVRGCSGPVRCWFRGNPVQCFSGPCLTNPVHCPFLVRSVPQNSGPVRCPNPFLRTLSGSAGPCPKNRSVPQPERL